MYPAAHDWAALLTLAFVLGLRHGLDADHLAAIDGLARFNAQSRGRLAGWCGFLFSLGHGLVVCVIAAAAGAFAASRAVPAWLADLGAWISIVFLFLLGGLNLAAVLAAQPGEMVRPVGLKGRWLGRFARVRHPAAILLVGALFALSLDTVTQALVLSFAAAALGGGTGAVLPGIAFMAGMMVSDGANGLWVARLLARADRRARIASRAMGLAVAALSLTVGSFGLAGYFFPAAAGYVAGRELVFGVLMIAAVALSYFVALKLEARAAAKIPL